MIFTKTMEAFYDNPAIDPKTKEKFFGDMFNTKYIQSDPMYYDTIGMQSSPKEVKNLIDYVYSIPEGRRNKPPTYDEYINYQHRSSYSTNNLRIGDCEFYIPMFAINITTINASNNYNTLRQKTSLKNLGTYERKELNLSLYFNGEDQINGFKVDSPLEYPYYVDGLRTLISQFMLTPFLPIQNEYINNAHNIFTVALSNINVCTLDGFPNVLVANLTLVEMNTSVYTEVPDVLFDELFDWDLYRFYTQQLLREGDKNYLKPFKSNDNTFKISMLNQDALNKEKVDDVTDENNFIKVLQDTDDIKINLLNFSMANTLPFMQNNGHIVPTFQYIGSQDTNFVMVLETTKPEIVSKINQMNLVTKIMNKQNKDKGVFGFIKIDNSLINLTGNEYFIINNMNTKTVEEFPGLNIITIEFSNFDIRQRERENINGMRPFPGDEKGTKDDAITQDATGIFKKACQDITIEKKMMEFELYPDLMLPTVDEVNEAIKKIKKFRQDEGLEQLKYSEYPCNFTTTMDKEPYGLYVKYVDPDFYVFYPTEYSNIEDSVFKEVGYTKKFECVKTVGRDRDWGDEVPDGFGSDEEGNLKWIGSGSKSGSGTSNVDGATGNALADILIAKQKEGCGYVWAAHGEMCKEGKWKGKQVFDCSGFISWGLRELGLAPKGQRWGDVELMDKFTTSITKDQLQPGDLLDHPGEHIACYIGNGKTVEAKGKDYGVVIDKSEGRQFSRYGRVKGAPTKDTYTGGNAEDITNPPRAQSNPIKFQDDKLPHAYATLPTEEQLNKILRGKLAGKAKFFIQCGVEFGINPAFIAAICIAESGGDVGLDNNPSGSMEKSNPYKKQVFPTLEEGIKYTFYNIKSYAEQGMVELSTIKPLYCPTGANNDINGTNGEWEPLVKALYMEETGSSDVLVCLGDNIFVDNAYNKFKYKKNTGAGITFGARKQETDFAMFGLPLYKPSPLNVLYKDDQGVLSKIEKTFGALYEREINRVGDTLDKIPFIGKPLSDLVKIGFKSIPSIALTILNAESPLMPSTWIITGLSAPFSSFKTKEYKDAANEFVQKENQILSLSCVDMKMHNYRGRLCRAFPSYVLMICDDGGDWLDARKLWTNFYIYKSVLNIAVHQEKCQPVHTANLTITNLHHNLDKDIKNEVLKKGIQDDPEYLHVQKLIYKLTGSLWGTPKLTEQMVDVKNQLYNNINMKTGCRIHIRLGYGSNPIMYPTTFSGIVTDMNANDAIEIVAQSFGHELINNVLSTKETKENKMLFDLGSEPSNFIASVLTEREGTIRNTISKKWGEASRYGIEDFGIPRGHEVIAPEKEYDIIKNIYLGKYKPTLFCGDKSAFNFDGEDNANFFLYNKTPWDGMQHMAQTVPEFLAQPMYHQFDCRFFFGLPYWTAKYRYDISGDTIYESAKCFSQFHYIDSLSDIIDNQLNVTSLELFTNCVAMYSLGGEVKSSPIVYSDRSIEYGTQKTQIIDCTLSQDYLGPDWLYEKTFFPIAKCAAIKMAVSNLIDVWGKTYEKEVVIMGDASIKPCDYLFINDNNKGLYGLSTVREVVHQFSCETGFISNVTPELIACSNMNNSGQMNIVKTFTSFGSAMSSVKNSRYISNFNFANINNSISFFRGLAKLKYGSPILTSIIGSNVSLKLGDYALDSLCKGKMYTKSAEITEKVAGKVISASKSVSNAAKGAEIIKDAKALKTAKNITTGARGIVGGIKLGITAAGSFVPGIGNVVAWLVGTVLLDTILGSIIDEFAYNNSITVFPLVNKDGPFLTNDKGATSLVSGFSEKDKKDENGKKVPDKETESENKKVKDWSDKNNG